MLALPVGSGHSDALSVEQGTGQEIISHCVGGSGTAGPPWMETLPGSMLGRSSLPWGGSEGSVEGTGSTWVLASQLPDCEEGGRQRVSTQAGKPLSALTELLLGSNSGCSWAGAPWASSAATG